MKKDQLSRRQFLKYAGLVSLGFSGLQSFACNTQMAIATPEPFRKRGYGPLHNDRDGIMNLPKRFTYKIISEQGMYMDDDFLLPGKPDGMATFVGPKGSTIVVRNHEVSPEMRDLGPFGEGQKLLSKLAKDEMYDMGRRELPCLGGTTTFVYNTKENKIERQFLSLAGTTRNCAGGPTPWNSWISCEETVDRAGMRLEKDHGYPFEVPATSEISLADPIPLKDMGRFQHEAVGVDPRTSIVYQTEDRNDGVLYRFLPAQEGKLHNGGKLQALKLRDFESWDTRNWEGMDAPKVEIGVKYAVEWIDLDGIDSPYDDLRYRAFEAGAARFARGEGVWFGEGECFFACTSGGKDKTGQIFRYIPSRYEGDSRELAEPGVLELFVEPNNTRLVENCDNLTMSPKGDLVVCEDKENPRVIGITPDGHFYVIAENVGYPSEFAGATFSPDGSTLFVNIQHAGLTLAIQGPWMDRA
ncbi:MAG: alkaline phosphatase PhoX [Bacteroidota bacterium]